MFYLGLENDIDVIKKDSHRPDLTCAQGIIGTERYPETEVQLGFVELKTSSLWRVCILFQTVVKRKHPSTLYIST